MEAPRQRRFAAVRCSLALAGLFAAAGALAEWSLLPAGIQPFSTQFHFDRRLGESMRDSLDDVLRRVSDPGCQAVLTDFQDPSGRRLDANLNAIGTSLPAYLGLLLFYDGRATVPCANEHVLAWTVPGSRAVQVCWSQFSSWQKLSTAHTAIALIHETLHTLGLGESPPAPDAITARVLARCGQ